MRAKIVNEKFSEKSDPVSDMSIGGILFDDEYQKIEDKATRMWIQFLKNTLEGKTLNGTMMAWNESGHNWREFTIYVKQVMNNKDRDGFSSEITVMDEKNQRYTLIGDKKYYIN